MVLAVAARGRLLALIGREQVDDGARELHRGWSAASPTAASAFRRGRAEDLDVEALGTLDVRCDQSPMLKPLNGWC
ncbi:MAG: hypothetical protein EXR58_07755 [Chloroflexi bacterium]|nr:hypothetical protein [Chloroflexota bacterium]